MERFYNNPAWRRIRGLRGLGVFALSMALCLAGMLALSSCDLDFWDDDDDESEVVSQWRGFYISVDTDGSTDCTNESIDQRLDEEATNLREPNIRILASGAAFGDATFVQVGVKVDESDTNAETISTYYVSETDGSFDRPGSYFLIAKTDSDIDADTIYTGYWAGYAYRPGGEGTEKPVVVCPYVMVPAKTPELEDIGEDSCGGMDENSVHEDLAEYLMDDDGLRDCHNLLNADGVLSPMKR